MARPALPAAPVLGLGILGMVLAYAILVPWFAGPDALAVDLSAARRAPSLAHPFGTDSLGRDLFAQVAAALRVSLLIAAAAALLATCIGLLIGTASALAGGATDRLVMRFADATNALPHLILGIVIVAMFRGNIAAIILSIGLTHWVLVARITRSEALVLREHDYITAARLAGAGKRHILGQHIVPGVLGQALVATTLLLPHAVWHESTLSFLGLGLPPHQPSLGTLLADSRDAILLGSWWTLAFPAGMLVLATIALALASSRVGRAHHHHQRQEALR
ncbi:ABC transporter permease [Lolliginicoccus levis]|uniref:ABC transporter permease n=1 Tax=Lolliginicoccus levis TaxID=2919542 RepID=UPI00241EF511|nr:ABC transporter permease [Lolliginicoccus levis]